MQRAEHDQEFADLLTAVVAHHTVASRLQQTLELAENALSAALRIGDGVRRARRDPTSDRPNPDDLRELEILARRLEDATDLVLAGDTARALRREAAVGRASETARLALQLFAGLVRPDALPASVYAALAIRRRAKTGEVLVHQGALVEEICRHNREGLRPASGSAPSADSAMLLPEPIALSQSFAGCGSEIALRRPTSDLDEGLLEDTASSDLVIFTDRVAGPFSVVLAGEADDEWWAASSTSYATYRSELMAVLAARGIIAEIV